MTFLIRFFWGLNSWGFRRLHMRSGCCSFSGVWMASLGVVSGWRL